MTIWKGGRKEAPPAQDPSAATDASVSCPALAQFLRRVVQVQRAPYILVLGEMCGANISFLGERGFRVCMETDVRPRPAGTYAGALVWDALSLITPDESRCRTALLYDALAPGGAVLALFGPPSLAAHSPPMRYRILSETEVSPEKVHGRPVFGYPYQNGDIVRIFDRFDQALLQMRRSGRRDALFFKPRPDPSADRPTLDRAEGRSE